MNYEVRLSIVIELRSTQWYILSCPSRHNDFIDNSITVNIAV